MLRFQFVIEGIPLPHYYFPYTFLGLPLLEHLAVNVLTAVHVDILTLVQGFGRQGSPL